MREDEQWILHSQCTRAKFGRQRHGSERHLPIILQPPRPGGWRSRPRRYFDSRGPHFGFLFRRALIAPMALRRIETLPVSALITNEYFLFHFSVGNGRTKEARTANILWRRQIDAILNLFATRELGLFSSRLAIQGLHHHPL